MSAENAVASDELSGSCVKKVQALTSLLSLLSAVHNL
jgi:hypothetical protein